MERTNIVANVDMKITLTLTENEARALHVLVGYGFEPFIKVFYEKLGKHYLEPYHKECKNLFDVIYQSLPEQLGKFDKMREIINPKKCIHE